MKRNLKLEIPHWFSKDLWTSYAPNEPNREPLHKLKGLSEVDYLPIEAFKAIDYRESLPNLERYFLSSGTTSDHRSISPFSKIGLQNYKASSLLFFDMQIEKIFKDTKAPKGISLIPDSSDLTDSSLSQMLSWIAEKYDILFISADKLAQTVNELKKKEHVFLFGTGFHFVNYCDQYQALPLPEGWKIFETGGTKGKSRELSQDEYKELLTSFFSVTESQIISEYGMCELSAQAYRLGCDQPYRFPPWVDLKVEVRPDEFKESGTGALCIFDLARTDVVSYIRTQDLVTLENDQSFRLLGRLKGSPLKGCSLLYEKPRPATEENYSIAKTKMFEPSFSDSEKAIIQKLDRVLADQMILEKLQNEIKNDAVFNWTMDELKNSYQNLSLKTIQDMYADVAKKWLFIAPSTHSVAMIYPLCLASILGIEVKLKLSQKKPDVNSTIKALVSELKKVFELNLEYIETIENVAKDTPVFFQGSKESYESIKRNFDYIRSFTDASGVAWISDLTKETIDLVVRDILHLSQHGCMAARALIYLSDTPPKANDISILENSLGAISKDQLSDIDRLAIHHKWISDAIINPKETAPTKELNFYVRQIKANRLELADIRSTVNFFHVSKTNLSEFLDSIDHINGYIWHSSNSSDATKIISKNYPVKKLGSIGVNHWDGMHQGEALFSFTEQKHAK